MGTTREQFDFEAALSGQPEDLFGDGMGLRVLAAAKGCCGGAPVSRAQPAPVENPFGDL